MKPLNHSVVIVKNDALGGQKAIYVDGQFVLQRELITPDDIFEVLGISVTSVQFDYDWGLIDTPFPDDLAELPLEPT